MTGRRALLASLPCLIAGSLAAWRRGAWAADEFPPLPIGPDRRCAVCGMYPARFPKWMAQIAFRDGSMVAVESPAELFRFLQDMPRYDRQHAPSDVAAAYVTDHARSGWVRAGSAHYVAGSRAKGPMGEDLPAFAEREQARAFAAEQGGRVLAYGEVTQQLIAGLRGQAHHRSGSGM